MIFNNIKANKLHYIFYFYTNIKTIKINMDEKNVKKLSLRLYKIQLELTSLNDEKLKGIIKEIESIDKELLKENNNMERIQS